MAHDGQQTGKNKGQRQTGQNQKQKGNQQSGQQGSQDDQDSQGTGVPEWITFFLGLAVILTITGLLTYFRFTSEEGPPEIRVIPLTAAVRQGPAGYSLPVDVRNDGGETAADVLVQMTLEPTEGKLETVSFTMRFLAGGKTEQATVLFDTDPEAGRLSSTVSFQDP